MGPKAFSCMATTLNVTVEARSAFSFMTRRPPQATVLTEEIEFDYKVDDEFARRLGVAMLNLIALGKPDLK